MRIIRLEDAVRSSEFNAKVWTWDASEEHAAIQLFQWYSISLKESDFAMGMFLGNTKILTYAGCHTPESIWRVITDTLLKYDILCAPLAQDTYLALPSEPGTGML